MIKFILESQDPLEIKTNLYCRKLEKDNRISEWIFNPKTKRVNALSVNLSDMNLDKIPISFGKVKNFNISNNNIQNLENSPTIVEVLNCENSKNLTSLKGIGKISKYLNIKKCPNLTSLKGINGDSLSNKDVIDMDKYFYSDEYLNSEEVKNADSDLKHTLQKLDIMVYKNEIKSLKTNYNLFYLKNKMKKENIDKMSFKNIDSNNEIIKKFKIFMNGKDFTIKDIDKFIEKSENTSNNFLNLPIYHIIQTYHGNEQTLFHTSKIKGDKTVKNNKVFILYTDPIEDIDLKKWNMISDHPKINNKNITIGWIRFIQFNDIVWIDELQSDLPKYSNKFKQYSNNKKIEIFVLEEFIKTMKDKGIEKFYMPTSETKKDLYNISKIPESSYDEPPKKTKFKLITKDKFNDIESLKNIGNVWLFERNMFV